MLMRYTNLRFIIIIIIIISNGNVIGLSLKVVSDMSDDRKLCG